MSNDKDKREAMISRIRALMAKTTANGCTEAEAAAAAAHVDVLLGLYEIDLTEAVVQDQEVIRLDIKLAAHPVLYAAVNIGRFSDCKMWTEGSFLTFLGIDIDTEIAEYLTLMVQRAIDREVNQYSVFNADMALENDAGKRNMIHSFGVGMAARLGERLLHLKSKRDFSQKSSGFDLVLAKKPLIDEAFGTLGINLGRMAGGTSIRHTGAYNAGRTAADSVAINQGVAGSTGSNRKLH